MGPFPRKSYVSLQKTFSTRYARRRVPAAKNRRKAVKKLLVRDLKYLTFLIIYDKIALPLKGVFFLCPAEGG